MQFTIAVIAFVAALAAAAPTIKRQPQLPDTVYGVDPSKPFYLTAVTAGDQSGYTLQPFWVDYLGGVLGLQAIADGSATAPSSPRANFTLTGNHYGTQLYAYQTGPCTSAEFCDETLLQWSNNKPTANSLLTFHLGVDEPSFGGLAFYGAYYGGDFEAGESNYLVGAQDTDFTKAFLVCNWTTNPAIQLLVYKGTDSSCVPVTIEANQVPGF